MKGLVITTIVALAFRVHAIASQPTPVTVAGAESVSASGASYMPVLSANGRYIAFLSTAKNLVGNDNLAPYVDVFRHDLQGGQLSGPTVLISVGRTYSQISIGGANGNSWAPSMSANGQNIAFVSAGSNIEPFSDFNGSTDIFIAGVGFGRALVTAGPDGHSPTNPTPTRNVPLSDRPQMSADGFWIAFESYATNLTTDLDTNNESDVFLHNAYSNQTFLVSVASDGAMTPNGKCRLLDMTPDGRYILFSSTATNLLSNSPTNGLETLYVRDMVASETTLIPQFHFSSARVGCISDDGRFVLYKCEFALPDGLQHVLFYDRVAQTNFVVSDYSRYDGSVHMSPDARFIAYDKTNHVILWDRQTDSRAVVSTGVPNSISHSPVVSDDGSIVAFVSAPPNTTFQIYFKNMLTSQLRRLTETLSGGPSAKDHSSAAIAVAPGGEFVVFDSPDDNLVPNDCNQASDIFLHDVATNETRLISRAYPISPATTASGRAGITNSCISADGNRILFFSQDSNLVPRDTNGWSDAFIRDLHSGQTSPLSTNEAGLFGPTNAVVHGLLSAEGRYAFLGLLHPRGRSGLSYPLLLSIIRKDLETGETLSVVSNASTGGSILATPMFGFSISANGRWITYPSNDLIIVADLQTGVRTNLTPSDPNWSEPLISADGHYVLYAKKNPRTLAITDLLTGQRTALTNTYVSGATFSQNAPHIAYVSAIAGQVFINLYSIPGGTNALVCTNCWNPQLSADARFVLYRTTSTPYQLQVRDMQTGTTMPVTRNINGTGGANADATWPALSGDGRFVAYTSKATNLTSEFPNGWNNLYIYDRLQGSTIRITGVVSHNAGYGSGSASRPVLGPDGRTLLFQSFASDFVANDFNDTCDIFLLKLGEGDADNDGMSDSWEQTYFSTTDRDGSGDFDQDGQTDLAEYLAGTNPNDNESLLEVLTITSVNTAQRQLIWRAEPGKRYRVEYKSDLQGATWTSLGQVIYASENTASTIDTTASTEKRFYRVALVQ